MTSTINVRDLHVRRLQKTDLEAVYKITERLGWSFSKNELQCWFDCFKDTYLVLALGTELIGCMNVVNMNDTHAYIGIYVIKEEYRYQGLGKILWRECVKKAEGRYLVLSSSPDSFKMYEKRGFLPNEQSPYMYVVEGYPNVSGYNRTVLVEKADLVNADEVADYDEQNFSSVRRREYSKHWFSAVDNHGLAARKHGKLVGFVVATQCRDDVHRVGPLQADTLAIAKRLLWELKKLSDDFKITTDIPCGDNRDVGKLFRKGTEISATDYFISTGTDVKPNRPDRIWFMNSTGIYRA